MTPRKTTTKRNPTLQVVLPDDKYKQLIDMAAADSRSKSQMGSILIQEAIEARNSASQHSK